MVKKCKYPQSQCISRNGTECTFIDKELCVPMDEKGKKYQVREWVEDNTKMTAKVPPIESVPPPKRIPRAVPPVVDSGHCTSCPVMRVCQAIVDISPKGWNPWGYAGQKPCPGVLK